MNFPCQEDSKNNFHKTKEFLTNLDELSFLAVFALPKASSSGLVWTIWSSRDTLASFFLLSLAPTMAK